MAEKYYFHAVLSSALEDVLLLHIERSSNWFMLQRSAFFAFVLCYVYMFQRNYNILSHV